MSGRRAAGAAAGSTDEPVAAERPPWLREPLAAALASQRGHALLVRAPAGVGALPFALALAQAWLCEAAVDDDNAATDRPCGRCVACRLVAAHAHPDLAVLLPETLRRRHGWPLADDRPDDTKRKPSRQVRVDDVRGMIDWAQRTAARGRGKVALLHPAETLNPQAANALLKTLEEPPPGTRLVLTTADASLLLPTVVSRCQSLTLPTPHADVAGAWLAGQGVADAAVLLAACSGRPLDVLDWVDAGVDAAAWTALPAAVARGDAGALAGWPIPRVVDALQKLCHDAMARAGGGRARYFPDAAVPATAAWAALAEWSRELARVARHDEHPWQEALLVDALVAAGRQALAGRPATPVGAGRFATLGR